MPRATKPKTTTADENPVPKKPTWTRLNLIAQPNDIDAIDWLRARFAAEGLTLTRQKAAIAALHQLVQRKMLEEARRSKTARKPLRNR